jgi:hypothetical protein
MKNPTYQVKNMQNCTNKSTLGDLEVFLLSSLSKNTIEYSVLWALEDKKNFEELYQLVFSENLKLAWRAAWVLEKIHLKQPDLVVNKISELISALPGFKHDGQKRCSLLIILRSPLPDPISVELINICFDWLVSPKESIAIRVNCMKILEKICQAEPDLTNELILCLNDDFSKCSKGFQKAASNLLKKLQKTKN